MATLGRSPDALGSYNVLAVRKFVGVNLFSGRTLLKVPISLPVYAKERLSSPREGMKEWFSSSNIEEGWPLPEYDGDGCMPSKGSSDLAEKKLLSVLKVLLCAGDGVASNSVSA